MFGNENDRPYELRVDPASTATMSYAIGRLRREITVPFGVNVLWDAMSTIALAVATGASFAREIMTGTYASDMGSWTPMPVPPCGTASGWGGGIWRCSLTSPRNLPGRSIGAACPIGRGVPSSHPSRMPFSSQAPSRAKPQLCPTWKR